MSQLHQNISEYSSTLRLIIKPSNTEAKCLPSESADSNIDISGLVFLLHIIFYLRSWNTIIYLFWNVLYRHSHFKDLLWLCVWIPFNNELHNIFAMSGFLWLVRRKSFCSINMFDLKSFFNETIYLVILNANVRRYELYSIFKINAEDHCPTQKACFYKINLNI